MSIYNKHLSISITFLILFLQFNQSISAQKDSTKSKRIYISAIELSVNKYRQKYEDLSISEYRKLAPNSALLDTDLTDYTSIRYNNFNEKAVGSTNLDISLDMLKLDRSNYKFNPQFKVGIGIYGNSTNNLTIEKKEPYTRFPTNQTPDIDTLTKSYSMLYRFSQIQTNFNLILRTNPKSRISLYSGISASFGLSVRTRAAVWYSNDTMNIFNEERIDESFKPKSNQSILINIPFGIDLRIGKDHEFWSKLHLFFNARPSYQIIFISELGNKSGYLTQLGYGIKYSWK